MERHFPRSRELFRTDRGRPCPREWEDPQAKRCGGMERSGSLCGRVPAPRETRHGRQCGSIGKHLLARKHTAGKGSTCWQGNTLPAKVHRSTCCQARRRNEIYRAVSKRALSWSVWASMVMLSPFWRLMVANGSMSGISLPNASEITFINFA